MCVSIHHCYANIPIVAGGQRLGTFISQLSSFLCDRLILHTWTSPAASTHQFCFCLSPVFNSVLFETYYLVCLILFLTLKNVALSDSDSFILKNVTKRVANLQKLADEMISRGEMNVEEARKFVDEMVQQAQQEIVQPGSSPQKKEPRVIEIVDEEETKTTPPTSNSTPQNQVDNLKQQVESLQEELRRLQKE